MKQLIIALLTIAALNSDANEAPLVSPNVLNITLCSSIAATCARLPTVTANPKVIAAASWAPAVDSEYLYFNSKVDSDYYSYLARKNGHLFATTNSNGEYYGHPSQLTVIAFGNFSKKPVNVQIFVQQYITSHPEFYASMDVPIQTREFVYLKKAINPYRLFIKTSHEMIPSEFQVLYKK